MLIKNCFSIHMAYLRMPGILSYRTNQLGEEALGVSGERLQFHTFQTILRQFAPSVILLCAILFTPASSMAKDPYLRFGIGLDRPAKTYFHDEDCRAIGGTLLYGCTPGNDDFPVKRSLGDFDNVTVLEIGMGLPIGRTRLEYLLEYRPKFDFEGQSTWNTSIQEATARNISSLASMVVGYVDFNHKSTSDEGKVVPFIGAGIGIARNKMNDFQIRFKNTTTTIPGTNKTNEAWMLTAGIGYKIDIKTTLDLAWQYTDLGSLYTGKGMGQVNSNTTGDILNTWTQLPTVARLKGHGFRLSLRIAL